MNKNKYVEEIEDLSTTETIEKKKQKKKRFTRKNFKMLFILILFFLCVLGVTQIVKLHKEATDNLAEKTQVNAVVSRKMPLLNGGQNLAKPAASYIKIADNVPNKAALNAVKLSPQNPQTETNVSLKAETPVNASVVATAFQTAKEVPVVQTATIDPDYTLHDALLFKDNFLKGISCEANYQKLLTSKYKTMAMQNVLNNLSPYCSSQTNALDNMKTVFLKDKKRAMIAGYKANSPMWVAYIKAILVSTIEIRKLNPQTSKPKDIIYKAQNELYKKNVYQTTQLLRTLPTVMQEQMIDFFREADIYIRADNSLNELLLSFEKKGE